MPAKPRKFPRLPYGGGSFRWDEQRSQCVLQFQLDGRTTTVRDATPAGCMVKRDARLAVAGEESSRLGRLRNGGATVAELLESWFEYHHRGRAPQTQDGYRYTIRLVSETALVGMVAAKVMRGDIMDTFVAVLARHDVGQAALNKVRTHLGMAFDHGVDKGYVDSNPVRGVKMPGGVRAARKPVWLDGTQFPAMRHYLCERPSAGHVALLTGLLTGLRPGEVLGLCWDAIDLDAGELEVRRALQRSQGGRVLTIVDVLKTEESGRMVEMPADLIVALRWWKVQQARERLAAKEWTAGDAVFTNELGKVSRFDVLAKWCTQACRELGFPAVSPHKLRHTHASALLAQGLTHEEVGKHLGHINGRMSVSTYGHPMRAHLPIARLLADG